MSKQNYTERDWEEIAASLSGETGSGSAHPSELLSGEERKVGEIWKELGSTAGQSVDIDNAWNNVHSRIKEIGMQIPEGGEKRNIRIMPFVRIAAAILLLAAIGSVIVLVNNRQTKDTVTIASSADERNIQIDLPDGSRVWLNRNSEISWPREFVNNRRDVILKGEAFFEITPDSLKPFIINTEKGFVKVLGTSFNVITRNTNDEIEVLVESGKVLLSDNAGTELILIPGRVGTVGNGRSESSVNENGNYTAWRTDLLVYEGQKLDVVFSDLKRVHDIEIIADDQRLLNESLHGVFDKLPQDTIIQIICTTFNLNYRKEDGIYHLTR